MPRIIPNLWFDTEAEEAAALSTSTLLQMRTLDVAERERPAEGAAV
jgi:predicted 3-demethylubiquinone-9 3-methyltransferase (glyoxalase superfamily)